MEVLFVNYSQLNMNQPSNISTPDKTVYETCIDLPEFIIFYLGLQFINMFLGIPANLIVLWLIHKNKRESSTSDIFIFHLAVLDTFFCLIPPLELANLIYLTTSSTRYVLQFFYGVKDSTLLFLSCICLDRYMAVLHPITFTKLKDRQHRPVCACLMWLITLAYAVLKCIGSIPNFEKVFIMMILASFVFMVFCNISILWVLKQSGPGRDEMHPVKKRAFNMVLIILAIIVFNYFPPVALFPFQVYFSPKVFKCYIHYIAFGFMDISSSVQPLLYLSKEKPKCPGWCCECCVTEQTDDVNTAESSTVYTTNGPISKLTGLFHFSRVPAPPQAIQRLKDQNRLLTQEVTEKSERITQLEQEMSALIKQLVEARARSAHDISILDSTFK